MKLKIFLTKNWLYLVILAVIMIVLAVFIWFYQQGQDSVGNDGRLPAPIDGKQYPPMAIDGRRFTSVRQPLGNNDNFEINLSNDVVQRINNHSQTHHGFQIYEIHRLNLVEDFVRDIGREEMPYSLLAPENSLHLATHIWEGDGEFISYDVKKNQVNVRLENPVNLPSMQFDPSSRADLNDLIQNFLDKYFSIGFETRVDGVIQEGNYYRIEFTRVLNGISVYRHLGPDYLLISANGDLKAASLIITQFVEYTDIEYELLSAENFKNEIVKPNYPKNIYYLFLDPKIEEDYGMYGFSYSVGAGEVQEKGVVNIDDVKVVYLYESESQEVVVPIFLFTGKGYLLVDDYKYEAEFTVLASALELKYINRD